MLATLAKRLVTVIPTLIGVVIVTFLLTRVLPGDPAVYFAGPAATPQSIADIRKSLGLDRPLPEQFARYVSDLAHGNLGNSLSTGQPVVQEIRSRLPASAELTLFGLILSSGGRPPARHSCRGQARLLDRSYLPGGGDRRRVAAGVLHRPAAGLHFLFSARRAPAPIGRLDAFTTAPAAITGFYVIDSALTGNFEAFRAAFSQLILPAFTLGIFSLAPIARMTRASMLAVLASDFVRTARASGLDNKTIIFTYAFRNAMLPVVTTLGMVFSFLLGANVLVEKVFAWPGIGSYAVEALLQSDFAPVQGFVLAMAILYVALNLIIDILYGVIDPRVRLEG